MEHIHTFIETERESEVANHPVLGRFLGVLVHSMCSCGEGTSEWHSEIIESEGEA